MVVGFLIKFCVKIVQKKRCVITSGSFITLEGQVESTALWDTILQCALCVQLTLANAVV